ncbi:hypothetical protein Q4517_05555 [Tenacibaculum sp. 1_MG-2023]|uniref:hypothetical protein n=1 Tax=Tenacibaculum sp. 1_MG-2023 TaxID=3062653 RepID=UPI0026E26083|nr:hypothetical protein [Tenacibaculum sp. 1_MG-2023]MDO6675010.1 hypothetical protein [Tenacibaculum sp. 1_MG-2023]
MKSFINQLLPLLLLFTTVITCKDVNNKSNEAKNTISVSQLNTIKGNYTLTIERKEGTGETYISSYNPSIINHELNLEIAKNKTNRYTVKLNEFSIQVPSPICTFVYDSRIDTTGNTKGSFGKVYFKKEKQEKLNKWLAHYKKLKDTQFLFERTADGTFKFLSGEIPWKDYKNKVNLRHGDPILELKTYINPKYLTMVLNQTFNYAEGRLTPNTLIKKDGATIQLNTNSSWEEHELFQQRKESNYTITARAYLTKTDAQWIRSNILETKLTPHRANGINNIAMTTTIVQKKE